MVQVGIQDLYKKKPSELSGGEQQRCAIAGALVMDTPVVLADEPTGSLDKNSGIKVMELLEGLHEQGKTLIIVTHDMDIAEHADRIIQIEDGKIVADTKRIKKYLLLIGGIVILLSGCEKKKVMICLCWIRRKCRYREKFKIVN